MLEAKENDSPRPESRTGRWGHSCSVSVRSGWGENGKARNESSKPTAKASDRDKGERSR